MFGARYLINDDWGVEGSAGWGRLMNDAAEFADHRGRLGGPV